MPCLENQSIKGVREKGVPFKHAKDDSVQAGRDCIDLQQSDDEGGVEGERRRFEREVETCEQKASTLRAQVTMMLRHMAELRGEEAQRLNLDD